MRGISNVITIVMAVILAASIMVLAFNILGSAKKGVEDIEGTAKTQQERLAQVQSLSQACQDWLYGGDKFKAEAILNNYELPDKMKPYRDVRVACGSELENLARECMTQDQEGFGDCAGSGYISASAMEIDWCTRTCTRVVQIEDTCAASCPDKKGLCFEALLNQMSVSALRSRTSSLTLTDSMIKRACEG